MGSACDVSGAAHLPADVAASDRRRSPARRRRRRRCGSKASRPRSRTAGGALEGLMEPFGDARDASTQRPRARSGERCATSPPFAAGRNGVERPLWRISTAPTRGAELAAAIDRAPSSTRGVLRLGRRPHLARARRRSDDAGAARDRPAPWRAAGGHATLIRAPAAMRAAIDGVRAAGGGGSRH